MSDDFSSLTGGIGDLNGDGKVSFTEYVNENHDYNAIMQPKGAPQMRRSHSDVDNIGWGETAIIAFCGLWMFAAGLLMSTDELQELGIIKEMLTAQTEKTCAAIGFGMVGVLIAAYIIIKVYVKRRDRKRSEKINGGCRI